MHTRSLSRKTCFLFSLGNNRRVGGRIKDLCAKDVWKDGCPTKENNTKKYWSTQRGKREQGLLDFCNCHTLFNPSLICNLTLMYRSWEIIFHGWSCWYRCPTQLYPTIFTNKIQNNHRTDLLRLELRSFQLRWRKILVSTAYKAFFRYAQKSNMKALRGIVYLVPLSRGLKDFASWYVLNDNDLEDFIFWSFIVVHSVSLCLCSLDE